MVLNQLDISFGRTNDPSLRSFIQDGVCPGDNSRAEMELISQRIVELQKLEMELATRYGMVEAEIDSVEVFEEAKYRAFSDDARCIEEAQQLYELYTLRHQCATYPGGFEAVSLASAHTLAAEGKTEE
ncbi:hypothetical protein EDD85DRAFT_943113 [Armillaria nabsnona]|nr:hypothetical protein EDD85DRAFT_943113 [Armillaria nabsnona]